MLTNRRLDNAFENAKVIDFDDSDKFIIFSDVHRGDNSIADEFAHNQNIYIHALNQYYDLGYTYIENGDGDELWEHAQFYHIRFAHSDVYELISKFYKNGRFIMLYGNHNMQFSNVMNVSTKLQKVKDPYNDTTINLFPDIQPLESIILKYRPTGQELFVVHGHQGDLMNDQLWRVSHFWMHHFWRYMHIVGFNNPASPAKSAHKRHKIERRYVKWIEHSHHLLIVGHTHRPKFSYPGQDPYFNSGSCVRPRNITGLEIVNGAISLVEWRIWPDPEGKLQVVKKILYGPVNLKAYLDGSE